MSAELLIVALATMSPVLELRGGIPLGFSMGLSPEAVLPLAIIVNCLMFFPVYFGLVLFYERFFSRFAWARKLIDRVQKRGTKYVERYGIIGLALFVGVPLPVTGVWTGTGAAWFLGLDWKRSFLAICLGVLMSATIVSLITLGFLNGIRLASV